MKALLVLTQADWIRHGRWLSESDIIFRCYTETIDLVFIELDVELAVNDVIFDWLPCLFSIETELEVVGDDR